MYELLNGRTIPDEEDSLDDNERKALGRKRQYTVPEAQLQNVASNNSRPKKTVSSRTRKTVKSVPMIVSDNEDTVSAAQQFYVL